ncbi:hypothetical protein OSTOST_08103 [Ostertagia ostertagi]
MVYEPPHIDSTLSVTVEEGQTLRLKCTAGEGIDEETLKFERELEEVHGKRTPRSVSQHIFNFDDTAHSGLYECFARTKSGEEHSRKMRVSTKMRSRLRGTAMRAPPCKRLLITTAKVVAGAGGTLNVVLIFLTVLFATLFIKERQYICSWQENKKQQVVHVLSRRQSVYDSYDLNSFTQWKSKTFFVKPHNPYNDTDGTSREKVHLQRSNAFDRSIHRSTRPSAFRRFRIAIRDRLSAKPSGISAETPPILQSHNALDLR